MLSSSVQEAEVITTRADRRKLPSNVPNLPIYGISFHYEECVFKWKYVTHRQLADENVISDQHRLCSAIIDLITRAGLLQTVTNLGVFYSKLVLEFIVNLPIDLNEPTMADF